MQHTSGERGGLVLSSIDQTVHLHQQCGSEVIDSMTATPRERRDGGAPEVVVEGAVHTVRCGNGASSSVSAMSTVFTARSAPSTGMKLGHSNWWVLQPYLEQGLSRLNSHHRTEI